MEIDSIEVVRAAKEAMRLTNSLYKEKVGIEEKLQWFRLISIELAQELQRVGYWKTITNAIETDSFVEYSTAMTRLDSKELSKEDFLGWCVARTPVTTLFDSIERIHQRELGLSEAGYEPSDRLKAGRKALAEYQESQRGVDPFAHAPLFDKFKETIIGLGWTVEDFLEISEVLP